mmetsp:Transcript_52279/g.139240  ORF Transcript_52279/g.139240 Transcript_52279/m.139240 type:complete len:226 (-) Transcript_52279:856-1533(-)
MLTRKEKLTRVKRERPSHLAAILAPFRYIRFPRAWSGRNFFIVWVSLHCRYILKPAGNFGQHVVCLVHPRHHHGDHESDQEDKGKDHGGSPSVKTAARCAVVGGFRFVIPEAHHRDHLRSTHEVAELDPTPDADGEHPRCHACQTTPTRSELPESREEGNDECDGDDVCHGEEIRDLHRQPIEVFICVAHSDRREDDAGHVQCHQKDLTNDQAFCATQFRSDERS